MNLSFQKKYNEAIVFQATEENFTKGKFNVMQLFQKYSFYTQNKTLFKSKNQNTPEHLHMKAWLLSRQNVSSVLNPYRSKGPFLAIKKSFEQNKKTHWLNFSGVFLR